MNYLFVPDLNQEQAISLSASTQMTVVSVSSDVEWGFFYFIEDDLRIQIKYCFDRPSMSGAPLPTRDQIKSGLEQSGYQVKNIYCQIQ